MKYAIETHNRVELKAIQLDSLFAYTFVMNESSYYR